MTGKQFIRNILTVATLSLLAGASLGFSSCLRLESQDLYSDIPMSFGSYVPRPASKAAAAGVVTEATLPANSSFGVFAFYQPGVVGSTTGAWSDGGWTPAFMFNQEVAYSGSEYSYSPLRYWPANEENTLSFWAYWPYDLYSADNSGALKFYESDGTTAYSNSSEGLPRVNYTVPKDPAAQYDILFDSFARKDLYYLDCTTPGTVDLTFRHALCLVEFKIKEGTGAQVTSFHISNLYWNGSCSDLSARTWQVSGDPSALEINDLTVEGNTICKLMMLPQTLDADATLTINYDIQFASSDPDHPDPIVYSGNVGSVKLRAAKTAGGDDAGLTAWQAGMHYVYTINAGFERIEFEEVVELGEDWTSAGEDIEVTE